MSRISIGVIISGESLLGDSCRQNSGLLAPASFEVRSTNHTQLAKMNWDDFFNLTNEVSC